MEVAAAARMSSQSPALGDLLPRTMVRMSPSKEFNADNFNSAFIVFSVRGARGQGPILSYQGKQIVADWRHEGLVSASSLLPSRGLRLDKIVILPTQRRVRTCRFL